MNFDETEITKFEKLAAHWWEEDGPCKPLHQLNPLRLTFIQTHCSLGNKKILDIGCGGGILTEALSRFSPYVTGIDKAPSALAVAKQHASSLATPPHYEEATAEEFAKQYSEEFDVITCMELLEHVPSPPSLIGACSQLLKPGGHLFFSTLNRTPAAFIKAIIGGEYVMKILPKGTHHYSRFIRPSELAEWTIPYPLQLKHLKGIQYRLLNKTFYLSSDLSVNYLAHFQKEINE